MKWSYPVTTLAYVLAFTIGFLAACQAAPIAATQV